VKKKKAWKKNFEALRLWERTAGRFVIRSDWLEDPIEALKIYRRRNIVEIAFRQFKVLNDGDRLQAARTSYMGDNGPHNCPIPQDGHKRTSQKKRNLGIKVSR